MEKLNPKVDAYLGRATKWQAEMTKLRSIAVNSELTEELKWGKPCYTLNGGNVVLIVGFKEWCAFLFTKGALLKDLHGLLTQPTENSQAARQMRFAGLQEIINNEAVLKAYLQEAIEVEKSGNEVTFRKISEFVVPEELQVKFEEDPTFKLAFNALTPGRQRAYYLHFAQPKQVKTRISRIEKCTPDILNGKGLKD